ncbi:gliding motility-associated ABC transporter permease subunit GldF [Flavobacteriaceae bacterium F89]|uniref:Gliding motility-associated ABC transporter permease subunit GldF n=1 Tax=Cerina litoralis TaxID=2874477 RepID=A0AAE3JNX2_9FLAO|nr:gliding motility-associated ABC transporter permease subunit GldF [Cerina litoralis]MCG2460396.1 gliding motility-associated ABC transporter permease subunit GldF [Cerina litoralis]
MLAIFKREVQSFFTSPIGYLVIGLFLTLNGLFLWVFKGPFNIFDAGFANLDHFFLLTPWVFLFLIPAITMKSFSEERKLGTLELLFIKPISLWQTVIGKFLGTVTLAILALIPTLLYVYCVSRLGTTVDNIDMGVVLGSYFGVMFLIVSYTAIGLFCSTLTENQIVAFLFALIVCFVLYYGFEGISTLFSNGDFSLLIQNWGMKAHYESIARGVIDTKDLVYFIALTLFFLYLTVLQLQKLNR